MAEGVDILAASGGVVRGIRDGEVDHRGEDADLVRIRGEGKECGNGVAIDHGNDVVTQYCHMKNFSITISVGQTIQAGQKLGEVGFSGDTQFPHVHFELKYKGCVIDPFTGASNKDGCGVSNIISVVPSP